MPERKPVPKAIFVRTIDEAPPEPEPIDEIAEAVQSAEQEAVADAPPTLRVEMTAGPAFRLGFFAWLGAMAAMFVVWLAIFLVFVIFGIASWSLPRFNAPAPPPSQQL